MSVNRYGRDIGKSMLPRLQNMTTRTDLGREILKAFLPNVTFSYDFSKLESDTLKGQENPLFIWMDECGPEYDYVIADAYSQRAEYLASIGIILGEN